MITLPAELIQQIRLIAMDAVLRQAPTRAEHAALAELVHARLALVSADDLAVLQQALPALGVLRPGTWVTAAEVEVLAQLDRSPAGLALRAALAPMLDGDSTKRIGRLLTRGTGVPVDGLYLRRVAPPHRRDAALYMVVGPGL